MTMSERTLPTTEGRAAVVEARRRAQLSDGERNNEILRYRIALFEHEAYQGGPQVGEYVIMTDGSVERFSHDWGETIQTSPGGSFYLGDGYASFSGALNPSVAKDEVALTSERRSATFWFFSRDFSCAGGGVDVHFPVRVWKRTEAAQGSLLQEVDGK